MARMIAGLDEHAKKWARLLMDPCGAPLVQPCTISSNGTGLLVRKHTFGNPFTAPNNDLQLFALFGTNNNPNTAGIFYFGQCLNGASGTVGGAQTLFQLPEMGGSSRFRCVAGCVKVHFLGPESTRQGLVGLGISSLPPVLEGQTGVNSGNLMATCQRVARIGSEAHEIKWFPMDSDDSDFSASSTSLNIIIRGAGDGVTAPQVQIEYVAVYEYQPFPSNNTQIPISPSPSRNTPHEVIKAMGDYASWGFGHLVLPTIKAIASSTATAVTTGLRSGAAAQLLLT